MSKEQTSDNNGNGNGNNKNIDFKKTFISITNEKDGYEKSIGSIVVKKASKDYNNYRASNNYTAQATNFTKVNNYKPVTVNDFYSEKEEVENFNNFNKQSFYQNKKSSSEIIDENTVNNNSNSKINESQKKSINNLESCLIDENDKDEEIYINENDEDVDYKYIKELTGSEMGDTNRNEFTRQSFNKALINPSKTLYSRICGNVEEGSLRISTFTLITFTVGAGCLCMPYIFSKIGILFSSIFLLILVLVSYWMINSLQSVSKKFVVPSFNMLVEKILGSKVALFVEIFIFTKYFLVLVSYIMISKFLI